MIEGSLRNVPLSDVFQIAVTGQKSGILTVVREGAEARIFFEQGNIQSAHLVPGVHLGEILVRMDLLTALEVQELLSMQRSDGDGTPLGLIAVERGMVDANGLHRAVERQVVEVLSELLSWRDGNFVFSEQSLLFGAAHDHDIDAMAVLMKVAQQISDYETGSAAPSSVFQRSGDPTKVDMPPGGWEILGHIDGTHTSRNIASELDLSEGQVYHLLFTLERLGVIEPSPFDIVEPVVLLLSPSSALRQLLRLTLQRAQCEVVIAADEADALAYAEGNYPRVVVVDDHGGSGWVFVRELRKLPTMAHTPVVLLTDSNGGGLLGRFRRPKATVVSKPFQETAFQQLIGSLVGRSLA
jgi:CheY-like chemotaxis protein